MSFGIAKILGFCVRTLSAPLGHEFIRGTGNTYGIERAGTLDGLSKP